MGKVNGKIISVRIIAFIFIICITFPCWGRRLHYYVLHTTYQDTIIVDTVPIKDSSKYINDSIKIIKQDTLHINQDKDSSLETVMTYEAEDSGVLLIPTQQFILYNKANAKYGAMNLKAGHIEFDQTKQLLKAYGIKDTSGKIIDRPMIAQDDINSQSDTIYYNMGSHKGLTKGTYTKQGEMFVYGERIKRVSENTYFAYRARFTTCNLDTPHYAFRTRKLKMINQKFGVSGPAFPEFEGVPIPVVIPFGLYPLNKGQHSGILTPQIARSEQLGLGLEGLGYYKVLNEYIDLTVRTNIYSYGTWMLYITPTYRKRYRYQGGLSFSLLNTKYNFKGDPDYSKTTAYSVVWNHTRDSKARPGTSFSANVNYSSTKYNSLIPNNVNQNFINQQSSSIAYSKDWGGKYNLSLNLNHNQNNSLHLVNLNLPNASFNVVTFYPFQKKELLGTPKWYEKLGIGYSGNLQNAISFYDTAFSLRQILDTLTWGVQHNIPLTLSLPAIGALTIAPNISYQERWYGRKLTRVWNPTNKKVDSLVQKGLYTTRNINFGVGVNTAIFGTFNVNATKPGIVAIRHVIRPSISINYSPNLMNAFYKTLQVDTTGRTQRVSVFDGGIYGPFPGESFGGMSFGLDNNLEMKWRSKKDTGAAAIKKIKLIDGFGFNGSYNFLADSLQLSQISLYARSQLFDKININANATLEPYVIDKYGVRTKQLAWTQQKFSLGTITGGSISASASFQSKQGGKKKTNVPYNSNDYVTPDEQNRQLDYIQRNSAEFADFNTPWTLSTSFSLNFSRVPTPDYSHFTTQITTSLSLNGDINLSPKWKIGGSSYVDLKAKELQSLQLFISRELHCWQMSINVTPIGPNKYFNITISPKSGLLRDLRINRTRYFYNQN